MHNTFCGMFYNYIIYVKDENDHIVLELEWIPKWKNKIHAWYSGGLFTEPGRQVQLSTD